jgi:hypothetical protein
VALGTDAMKHRIEFARQLYQLLERYVGVPPRPKTLQHLRKPCSLRITGRHYRPILVLGGRQRFASLPWGFRKKGSRREPFWIEMSQIEVEDEMPKTLKTAIAARSAAVALVSAIVLAAPLTATAASVLNVTGRLANARLLGRWL